MENINLKTFENMTKEELLKRMGDFETPYEIDGKYRVTTAYCSLGGCEYRWFECDSEIEALIECAKRTARGEKPDVSCACQECYTEYMKDCI